MLDMGFAEDLDAILAATPTTRQTALFSATLPPRIAAIARRHLQRPRAHRDRDARPAAGRPPRVRQTAYVVAAAHKLAALGRILDLESPAAALVFCRTRIEVDDLTESLNGPRLRAEALHGGISQEAARPGDGAASHGRARARSSRPTSPRAASTSSTSRTS